MVKKIISFVFLSIVSLSSFSQEFEKRTFCAIEDGVEKCAEINMPNRYGSAKFVTTQSLNQNEDKKNNLKEKPTVSSKVLVNNISQGKPAKIEDKISPPLGNQNELSFFINSIKNIKI